MRAKRIHTGTKAWFAIRKQVLDRDEYTCADCFGYGNHVDHKDGNALNNSLSNLQVLCIRCHGRKTALVDGGFGRAKAKRGGFDSNGEPLDPESPYLAHSKQHVVDFSG